MSIVAELVKKGSLKPGEDFFYVKDTEGLKQALQALGREGDVAIDTETTFSRDPRKREYATNFYNQLDGSAKGKAAPLDPHTAEVRLIQMRGRETLPYVIDLWALPEADKGVLKDWFLGFEGCWLLQNAKFDLKMIAGTLRIWIDHKSKIFDVRQASVLLGNSVGGGRERGHRLIDLARDFLRVDLDKTEQSSDWGVPNLSDEQLEYAALDVVHLHALKDILYDALAVQLEQPEPLEMEMAVIGPTARMEYNGLPINLELYHKVQEAAEYNMPALLGAIGRYFFEKIQQPLTTVYVEIRKMDGTTELRPYKLPCDAGKGKAGKDFIMSKTSTVLPMLKELELLDEEGELIGNCQKGVLEAYREAYPGVGMLIDFWNLAKQAQFDYDEYYHPVTGRIHARFNISGAGTGRFSCTKPNLQQVPKLLGR